MRFRRSWLEIAIPVILLLTAAGRLAAQTEVAVVDLLPLGADREQAAKVLSGQIGQPVALVPLDPLLLTDLRWASPHPAQAMCQEQLHQAAELLGYEQEPSGASSSGASPSGASSSGASPSRLLPELTGLAEKKLMRVELEAALKAISTARALLPCVDQRLTIEEIRPVFLLEAVARVFLGDDRSRSAFRELLAVDDQFRIDSSYPPAVEKAYLEALEEHHRATRVTLDTQEVADELFIDGRPAQGDLAPGTHVLQVKNPFGAVRTTLVSTSRLYGSRIRLDTQADLGLTPNNVAQEALIRALLDSQLEEFQTRALDRHLTRHQQAQILFALDPFVSGRPMVKVYRGNGGVVNYTPPPVVPSVRNTRIGVSIGTGVQKIWGTPDAYIRISRAVGPNLSLDYRIEPILLVFHVSLYPYTRVPAGSSAQSCGTYEDLGTAPTDTELIDAAACLPPRTLLDLGFGVGLPLQLRGRFWLTPSLFAKVAHYPNTLVTGQVQSPGGISVVDPWMYGSMTRIRSSYVLVESRMSVDIGLEVFAGMLRNRVGGQSLTALPAGLAVNTQARF